MSGDHYKIDDQNGMYFLTLTVIHWIDLFTRKEYKDILVDSLNYCIKEKGLLVYSWVIMSNHIHLVASVNSSIGMSGFLRDFKKFTNKRIIKEMLDIHESRKEWLLDKFSFEAKKTRRAEQYKIWKDGSHAIDLTNGNIGVWEKIHYIHMNPVKADIVDDPEEYKHSSARDYQGIKGLVNLVIWD